MELSDLVGTIMPRNELRDKFLEVARQLFKTLEPGQRLLFEQGLQKHILDQLGQPYPITLRELWRVADEQLPLGSEVCTDHLEDFRAGVTRRFRRYRESRRVLVGTSQQPDPAESTAEVVWSNGWVEVELVRVRTARRAHFRDFEPPKQLSFGRVFARLSGWASPPALRRARWDFRLLLRAALWAAHDLDQPGALGKGAGRLPPLVQDLASRRPFLSSVIGAYFAPVRVKDAVAARVRNAVHLLVQASNQEHDAIALALYCSSIEALLSRGKESITKSLAEDVATLLEPDRKARSAAITFVRELYNLRSRALHGDGLAADAGQRARARALATHVLFAVLERQEFDARIGAQASRGDAILMELEEARVAGDEFVGVTPGAIRGFWKKPSGKPASRK